MYWLVTRMRDVLDLKLVPGRQRATCVRSSDAVVRVVYLYAASRFALLFITAMMNTVQRAYQRRNIADAFARKQPAAALRFGWAPTAHHWLTLPYRRWRLFAVALVSRVLADAHLPRTTTCISAHAAVSPYFIIGNTTGGGVASGCCTADLDNTNRYAAWIVGMVPAVLVPYSWFVTVVALWLCVTAYAFSPARRPSAAFAAMPPTFLM